MAPLSLILAGPILRRVEPTSVSVWLALREDAGVYLQVFDTASPTTALGASGWQHPLKLGANVYVMVVTVDLQPALNRTKVYSYDLWFDTATIETLGTLGLSLGLAGASLPTFVLPPADAKDLLILHGSCRKPHGPGVDAFPFAEELLKKAPLDPLQRPQQLFLTGDQIYADDVADSMLMLIQETTVALFGNTPEEVAIDGYANPIPVTPANFPAGWRENLVSDGNKALSERLRHPSKGRLSSTDADSHLISFREFCTMYLLAWSDELWPKPWTPAQLPLTADQSAVAEVTASARKIRKRKRRFAGDTKSVKAFVHDLPSVRRVLANIATYMILDDHEITDDWYIFQKWRDQVLGTSLGRAIIRNGLAAYAMFQGWGNDPDYFRHPTNGDPDPLGVSVLEKIVQYAEAPGASPVESSLEELLGMQPGVPARWHYTVTSACHHVIVLDTRTRRSWKKSDSPPRLIDIAEMPQQITPATTTVDVNILISAAPILGVALMEDTLQEGFGVLASASFAKTNRRLGADYEAWSFADDAFEELLRHLVPLLPHLVLLGGDVHYSFSSFLTYWQTQVQKGRMVQLTSSALKNHSAFYIDREAVSWWERTARAVGGFAVDELEKYAFAYTTTSVARIGWNTPPQSLLDAPVPYFYDHLRKVIPVLLPLLEKVSGRTELIDTTVMLLDQIPWHGEWSWRWHLAFDTRDDDDTAIESRPISVRPQPLTNEIGLDDVLKAYESAQQRALRHVLMGVPRTLLFNTSIGRISFTRDTAGKLAVGHGLLQLDGATLIAPVAHTIPFDASAEVEPNIL